MISMYTAVIFTILMITEVSGHGRLLNPPSRASMWRENYDNPANFNDNQLFCGGRAVSINITIGLAFTSVTKISFM